MHSGDVSMIVNGRRSFVRDPASREFVEMTRSRRSCVRFFSSQYLSRACRLSRQPIALISREVDREPEIDGITGGESIRRARSRESSHGGSLDDVIVAGDCATNGTRRGPSSESRSRRVSDQPIGIPVGTRDLAIFLLAQPSVVPQSSAR